MKAPFKVSQPIMEWLLLPIFCILKYLLWQCNLAQNMGTIDYKLLTWVKMLLLVIGDR